jgi:chemotaxis protein methyltransferase CheR
LLFLDIYKDTLTNKQFELLKNFIESYCGIKMPESKKLLLESRIRKRLKALNFSSFKEYLDYVFNSSDGKNEIVNLINVVTTNKTDFFRENDHFDFLKEKAIPYFINRYGAIKTFKAWSAACSSGEEPYSILITLSEAKQQHPQLSDFYVLGTDISTAMLEKAAKAIYPYASIEQIPQHILKKYFLKSKDHSRKFVRIVKDLREKLVLKRQNFKDERYDIDEQFHVIFCRNALIYFEKNDQTEIIRKLSRHLLTGGFLFLGHSESIQDKSLPFEKVWNTIYRKVDYPGV